MTEGVQEPEDAASARAAQQARLRKERREAKLKAGGASRLDKITGLGGGIKRDPQPQSASESITPQPLEASSTAAPEQHGDPEEVDISQHYYNPTESRNPSNISEAQLRQMMLGLDPSSTGTPPGRNPFLEGAPPMPGMSGFPGMPGTPGMPGMQGAEGSEEDPMMKMMSQMMSGGMPGAGGANPFAGTPMEGLFGGGANPMQQAQKAAANKTANLWRILHAIFAIGLGLYVALSTTFTGTQLEREDGSISSAHLMGENSIEQTRAYFFYVFTSVEAVLLTTRYFFDKDRAPPSGWLWTISGFVPEPAKGYLRHALRYGQIFSTVRSDALVCVFVMGVCCWSRS